MLLEEWENLELKYKQATNFLRTYFLFIDFFTAQLQHVDVPRATSYKQFIENDKKHAGNIRYLCHKYVLQ